MRTRIGMVLYTIIVSVIITGGSAPLVSARNTIASDALLSRLTPMDTRAEKDFQEGTVERFLIDTLSSVERHSHDQTEYPFLIPLRAEYVEHERSFQPLRTELPGSLTRYLIKDGKIPTISLQSALAAHNAVSEELLDTRSVLAVPGKLAVNPSRLFAAYEVLIDRSKFNLELVGIKHSGEKIRLYACRVGLGSPEYPTPKGSFYLTTIFDDKPLWIPPQREWAMGQSPSRSVYGGHMLPFFKKIPLGTPVRSEEPAEDLDNISAPMQMVDTGTYRIHGTDSPWSVGSGQSHGCVRMLNKSVKGLADALKFYVGITGTRDTSPNGSYVSLIRPVKLILF